MVTPPAAPRVLVCGGRDWQDAQAVHRRLDELQPEAVLQGGASGADKAARAWARKHGVHCETWAADWKRKGKAAGPIRNQDMLDYGRPDLVLAFPGGRGTADIVRRARRAGVPVITHEP